MNSFSLSSLSPLCRINCWPDRRSWTTGTCLWEARPPTTEKTSPGTMMSSELLTQQRRVCVCFWVRGGSWNSSHPPAPLRQPLRPLDGCQRFWTVKHRWRREKERGSVLPLSERDHLNFVCLFVFSSHGFCFWHSGAEPDAKKHLLCHQQCLSSQRGRSSVGNLSMRDKLYLTPLRYRHSFWRRQCETQWGTLYRFYLFIRCLLNFKRTAALNKRFSKTGHEMCFCVYALPCQVFFMCLFYYFFGPVLYFPDVSWHVFARLWIRV